MKSAMGVLGKVIGGTLGLLVGGPIGALLGAAAGHVVADRKSDYGPVRPSLDSPDQRQAVFMSAVVILAAKLCKVDGHVTRDEIATFKRVFAMNERDAAGVGSLFNMAMADPGGYEPYARQIGELFGHDREMCKNLVGALMSIACADGAYHPAERRYISNVAGILGLTDREIRQVESMFVLLRARDEDEDPYAVLGVKPDASDAEIRAVHRKIIKENHPDLAMARGLPEELRKVGDRKLAAANAAYDEIKRRRKAA